MCRDGSRPKADRSTAECRRFLEVFASAQAFVKLGGLRGRRRPQLLTQKLEQIPVVPKRPPPFAEPALAAHQLPVGLFQQSVVADEPPVIFDGLRVATSA